MGLSEIITAIATVGLSSFILALVKLLSFFRDANKEKVNDIITRVDDDNKRWYTKYKDTRDELDTEQTRNGKLRVLISRYRVELLTNGVAESRLEQLEKETLGDE